MSKKLHANSKKVVAYREDGSIYKIFDTVHDAANYAGYKVQSIYMLSSKSSLRTITDPDGNKIEVTFKTERYDRIVPKEAPRETEDEVRRRLGLNPYGEWRTDEWIYAMIERVNKRLYPNGFDEHLEWQRVRGYERYKRIQAGGLDKEEKEDLYIDTRNMEL